LKHRRAGDNWFRSNLLPPERVAPAAAQQERMFAAVSLDDVLDRPLTLVPTAVVSRAARVADGAWTFDTASVALGEGIAFGVNLDQVGAALVEHFDGRAPLRPQLAELASTLGVPEQRLVEFAETLAGHLGAHGFAV
jgi:hypothetical protein